MKLHLKTPPELSARIRDLLPALESRRVGRLRVASNRRLGQPAYWLAFLYVGEMRYDIGTQALQQLPLAEQAEDLLRQLAAFSPTTVEERVAKVVAALTPEQGRQFASVCKLMSELSVGSQLVFWTSPKGSLSGFTPLEALVTGRYGEVCRTAEGYAER